MSIAMAVGRILFSIIFIWSGIDKILNWNLSEQQLVNSMLDLLSRTYEHPWAHHLFDRLMPHSSHIQLLSTIGELVGGMLILFGFQVRFGGFILFLFLVPTTLLFHAFWLLEGSARELQLNLFLKNLNIMGGCLILIAVGSKALEKKGSKKSE